MDLSEALEIEFTKVSTRISEIVGFPVSLRPPYDSRESYTVHGGDALASPVAWFKMKDSLQCNAIAVPFRVEVAKEFRGRGIGKLMEQVRIDAARASGYKLMLATTRFDNPSQIHIMKEAGWGQVWMFKNPKTGHSVILWMLVL